MKQWKPHAGRLTCPDCEAPLLADECSLRCPGGHAFPVTPDGYVDLLTAGAGSGSGAGGGSGSGGVMASAVRARQRFLTRGHYQPLVDGLTRSARVHLPRRRRSDEPAVILEAGCGAGYYVGQVARRLGQPATSDGGGSALGLDISREALRLGARSHPHVAFFRNDLTRRLCLADRSVDLILSVFAPRNFTELARICRPGGVVLVVVPTTGHLQELRSALALIGWRPESRRAVEDQLWGSGLFSLDGVERLQRPLPLESGDVADLLGMTPAFWRADGEVRRKAVGDGGRTVTLSVEVLRFTRTGMSAAGH